MRLEDLTRQSAELRHILARIIVNDPQYCEALSSSPHFFSAQELEEIEKQHEKDGLTTNQIQAILARKGVVLKPPTFKRYVGIKLVSGTKRIQKTERGSVGYYPAVVLRQINLIKYLLESKRDFLECFVTALGSTPSNALEIIQSNDPDALDIVENMATFKAYEIVNKHLSDLVSRKLITKANREAALEKARAFEEACDNVYQTNGALQDALENLEIPASYRIAELLEAIRKQVPQQRSRTKGSN